MMFVLNAAAEISLLNDGASDTFKFRFSDGTYQATPRALTAIGLTGEIQGSIAVNDLSVPGEAWLLAYTNASSTLHQSIPCVIVPSLPSSSLDAAGVRAAIGLAAANLDTQLAGLTPLTAAGVRAAVGLAAANLDTQLAALGVSLTPAQIRAAVGLAANNLDSQLAVIGPRWTGAETRAAVGLAGANLDNQLAAVSSMTPAQLRAALGLAVANLDQQFANIGPTGTSPTGIRQALGVKQPNLDDEINARNAALDELLQRFPLASTVSVGERR